MIEENIQLNNEFEERKNKFIYIAAFARPAGWHGSMSASGSAGPGFDPRWGSKF